MSLRFSASVKAAEVRPSASFSAHRLDLEQLGSFVSPVVGFDLFQMSGPTFAPHPHAGFSAVSYVFEDSKGALRNRDSLGNDVLVQPGELVWTQAASGVIHDEFPERSGDAVSGLQLFVNLSSVNKHIAPTMFRASSSDIPVVDDTAGNRTRVLSGAFAGVRAAIDPTEPFDFFDVHLRAPWAYSARPGWGVMLYVLAGTVIVAGSDVEHSLGAHEAIGIRADMPYDLITLRPQGQAHILLLCGEDPQEPVVVHGPFIMNTRDELQSAWERYHDGRMGQLA